MDNRVAFVMMRGNGQHLSNSGAFATCPATMRLRSIPSPARHNDMSGESWQVVAQSVASRETRWTLKTRSPALQTRCGSNRSERLGGDKICLTERVVSTPRCWPPHPPAGLLSCCSLIQHLFERPLLCTLQLGSCGATVSKTETRQTGARRLIRYDNGKG